MNTRLFEVARTEGYDGVMKLVRGGADVNDAGDDDWTPIQLAAAKGEVSAVDVLVRAVADVNKANKDGATPVYIASYNGHSAAVDVLIKAGADVDKAAKDGATPLFIASIKGHSAVVDVLVKAGANVDKAANDGATPLFVASQNGHAPIVTLLLAHGAKTSQTLFGTPLGVAKQKNHDEVVRILEREAERPGEAARVYFAERAGREAEATRKAERETAAASTGPAHTSAGGGGSGVAARWLIGPGDLSKGDKLGSGSFGDVFRADWHGTEVAMKVAKEDSAEARAALVKEVEAVQGLRNHPNVVTVMGVCERPLSLVVEFMAGGTLVDWLYDEKTGKGPGPRGELTAGERRQVAIDTACGMRFLHHERVVHRDLAARNVLLTEVKRGKIGDFGMSRAGGEAQYLSGATRTELGPVRWMAPEQFDSDDGSMHYSSRTDVYSFGVTLYELFAGQMPWLGRPNAKVIMLVGTGKSLEPPADAPAIVAEVMDSCLSCDATKRPTMANVHKTLAGGDWAAAATAAVQESLYKPGGAEMDF